MTTSWSKCFIAPIALPDGSKIATLDQARRFLLALPADRHKDADVVAAIDAVLMAAEGRGPVMHANVGIGRVVNGPPKIPEPRPSKERKWGRRKLAREQ